MFWAQNLHWDDISSHRYSFQCKFSDLNVSVQNLHWLVNIVAKDKTLLEIFLITLHHVSIVSFFHKQRPKSMLMWAFMKNHCFNSKFSIDMGSFFREQSPKFQSKLYKHNICLSLQRLYCKGLLLLWTLKFNWRNHIATVHYEKRPLKTALVFYT